MPIVDAHPHIYSPDRETYPTIEQPWEPGEPASAEDLKKIMDAVGVDRAVFIQTSTFYGHDNRYITDSAKEHADWACGVMTLDPDDQSHVDLLADGVANSNIRGMRGTTDSLNRIATPNVYRLWTKAMELGIPVNCMVMDDLERVPEIERIAQDLGDLKIIIDHCFMLNTRHRTEETLVALERLAQLPNVYAKLTAGTHGSYRVYPYVDMHDPIKRVIEAFSPARCVWGSNFPNALWSKGATYAQNLHLFVKELGLSLPDKADILGVTAMSLWFPNEHEKEELAVREQHQRTERESIQAQEAGEDPSAGDDQPAEAMGHTAQITMMADLIAAEGVIEGPILDEMDSVDLSAIMDSATELNAVLDTLDFPENPVKAKSGPAKPVEPSENSGASPDNDDAASEVTVSVEELFSTQNYTPINTVEIGEIGEIGESEDADSERALNVQAQLDAAPGSVVDVAGQDIEEVAEDGEESEADVTFNVEELLAAQDSETSDEKPEKPEQAIVDDIAANVQAQLDAAFGSVTEAQEIEIEENEPDEAATDELTVDVATLLAEQDETGKSDSPESEDDGEFDMSSIIEAADQLNTALESMNEESAVEPPVADPQEPKASEPIAESAAAPELLTNPGDGEEMDLAGIMDVANQLNSMLESVDDIASNINDLVVESDTEIDQSERPSS